MVSFSKHILAFAAFIVSLEMRRGILEDTTSVSSIISLFAILIGSKTFLVECTGSESPNLNIAVLGKHCKLDKFKFLDFRFSFNQTWPQTVLGHPLSITAIPKVSPSKQVISSDEMGTFDWNKPIYICSSNELL